MNLIKKEYPAIDLMKLVMAILIFLAHVSSEKIDIHPYLKLITSLYNFGVPFFITVSSFFFFSKVIHQDRESSFKSYQKFSKHIGMTYLYWSLIYFCFVVSQWIIRGDSLEHILSYLHKALVFTTYGTIWFLPALWVGVSICYLLFRYNVSIKRMTLIGAIFWIIGSLGYTYNNILEDSLLANIYRLYDMVLITTRNGIFFAFPAAVLGLLILNTQSNNRKKRLHYLILSVLFGLAYIVEAIMIKRFQLGANINMGIFMLPTVYYMVKWLITVVLPSHAIYTWFRNMSVLIFLSQRLFISAIPLFMSSVLLLQIKESSYLGLLVYLVVVVLFSATLLKLSDKYTIIKKLW